MEHKKVLFFCGTTSNKLPKLSSPANMPSSLQEDAEEMQQQVPVKLFGPLLSQDPNLLAEKLQEQNRKEEEEQEEEKDDDEETDEVEFEEEADGAQGEEEEEEEAPDLPFSNKMLWDSIEWWCHALLQQGSVDMIENLESLLRDNSLPTRGRLFTRLRAVAFWQDILIDEDTWDSIREKLQGLRYSFLLANANALMLPDSATQESSSPSHDETENWPIFQQDYEDAVRLLKVHEQFGKFERLLKVSNESDEDLESIAARFHTELKDLFHGQVPEELLSFLKVPDGEDHHVLKAVWLDQLHTMLEDDKQVFSRASLVSKLQQLVQSWCNQILTAPKLVRLGYSCMEDFTLEDVHVEDSTLKDVHVAVNPKPAASTVKKSLKASSAVVYREEPPDDDSDTEDDDTWDPSSVADKRKRKAASLVESTEYLDRKTNMVVAVPSPAVATRSKTVTHRRGESRKQKTAQKTNENNLSFDESSDEETDHDDAPPPQKRRRVQSSGKAKKPDDLLTSSSDDDSEDDFALATPVRSRARSLSSRPRVSLSATTSPHARSRSAPPKRRRLALNRRRMSAPKTYAGRRKFTDDESNAIKEGLSIYGRGKWAEIKRMAGSRLFDRSSVQIKDRYRSMVERGEIVPFNYDE